MTTFSNTLTLGPCKRLLLLGGGELLRMLCAWAPSNGYSVSVLTSPRHAVEMVNNESLEDYLRREGVPYLVADKIEKDEVGDFVGNTDDAFCLSLGAAWLFKADTIKKYFSNRLFNLHGTRLPQNRGGGGFSWQIITANRFGFCVLHIIDGGIDTGDIVLFDEFLYPAACRIPIDFENIYIRKNFVFLTNLFKDIAAEPKEVELVAQAEYFSTYWPRLHTLTNGWIDWTLNPYELERFICAFDAPYAGAQTYLNGQRVHLLSVSLNFQDGVFHSFQSGLIYRKAKSWICICVNGAALIVEKITDETGKDILDTVNIGDRFITPTEKLESSKQRVIYKPAGLK